MGRWAQRTGVFRPVLLGALAAAAGAQWVLAGGPLAPTNPGTAGPPPRQAGPRRVVLHAADKTKIVADFSPPRPGRPVFLLLHGLGAGRGEWARFRELLDARGWGSLAIDGRGHGESGGPRYTAFQGPADWSRLEGDLAAGKAFLRRWGVPPERVVPAGASIGANLALWSAVRSTEAPFAVLLSPGWDYQGVLLQPAVLQFGRPILFAASPPDAYAANSCRAALNASGHPESVFLEAASGHGVGMLDGTKNAAFVDRLMAALDRLVASRIRKKTSASSSGSSASP